MQPRVRLGLTSALLVLAACSTRTVDDASDDAGDDSETNPETGNGPDSTDSTDTGPIEPTCTVENHADDPQLGEFVELYCQTFGADVTCPTCDLACMQSILYDCEACFGNEPPDRGETCFNQCGDHLLLCSELVGDQCCYLVTANYTGSVPGRPLREAGVPRLPELTTSGTQSEAGRRYREFARYEWASVDAFSFAAVLLDELGAPKELVEAHRVAAREEAEHARLALACAESLDGCVATLGELAGSELTVELERFVCDLIHDGCVGELVAAGEAAWALGQPSVRENEALRRYWQVVLHEETGHAQLAWQTLEWLLAARPELSSVAASTLAMAMGSCAATRATLRESAIASLREHASDVVLCS